MNQITFVRTYAIKDSSLRVEFKGVCQGHTINCVLTLDEMQREFACGTEANFETEFRRLRPLIEARIRRLISDARH